MELHAGEHDDLHVHVIVGVAVLNQVHAVLLDDGPGCLLLHSAGVASPPWCGCGPCWRILVKEKHSHYYHVACFLFNFALLGSYMFIVAYFLAASDLILLLKRSSLCLKTAGLSL